MPTIELTKDNFEQILSKRPKIIHLSCHGVRNEQHTMGMNFHSVRDEGHFLLFENLVGDGELVSARLLRMVMAQSTNEIEIIFVAACDSEGIGRIFQQCGVKHVVCVEQKQFVLDNAAIHFTTAFYSEIFRG